MATPTDAPVLMSTDHCTLCEQALDLLFALPTMAGRRLRVVDVASDASLLDRYGPRLPVLLIGDTELDWPFSAEQVAARLERA